MKSKCRHVYMSCNYELIIFIWSIIGAVIGISNWNRQWTVILMVDASASIPNYIIKWISNKKNSSRMHFDAHFRKSVFGKLINLLNCTRNTKPFLGRKNCFVINCGLGMLYQPLISTFHLFKCSILIVCPCFRLPSSDSERHSWWYSIHIIYFRRYLYHSPKKKNRNFHKSHSPESSYCVCMLWSKFCVIRSKISVVIWIVFISSFLIHSKLRCCIRFLCVGDIFFI